MKIEDLIDHLQSTLSRPGLLRELNHSIKMKRSTAGIRREEVFTRDFLCPALKDFFYPYSSDLDLSDSGIQSGLGTEGYANANGFSFTPARERRHLFTKSEIVSSTVPSSWTDAGKPTRKQACPDFAIRAPLPFSLIGEVKFFKSESTNTALKQLYDAARQAVFYLGAFGGSYKDALIVVADASKTHAFSKGIDMLNPEIHKRFGEETNIYLSVISLQ